MKKLHLIFSLMVSAVVAVVAYSLTVTAFIQQGNDALKRDPSSNDEWQVSSTNNIELQFRDVQFLDESHGWGVTMHGLWKTNDGGQNWAEIRTSPRVHLLPNHDPQETMEQVQFLSSSEGWALEGNSLIHTTDEGLSWQKHEIAHVIIRSFHFLDSENGWCVGQFLRLPDKKYDVETWHPVIYATNDGGKNWRCLFKGEASRIPFWDVWSISLQEIWVVGAEILHTNDSGRTWKKISIKDRGMIGGIPVTIQFLDSYTGWITTNESRGYFFTNDGGKTWEPHPLSSGIEYTGHIAYVNSTEAWAAIGNLYRSMDSGKSWVKVLNGNYSKIQYLKNEAMIIAIGQRITKYRLH